MIFNTIIGFLILLASCSSNQQDHKSGLLIENSPNRGLNYTDTLGTKFSYRYIPISITNDSTVAIQVQINLSKEYDYPAAFGDQQFKVFIVPKEITLDKVTWDSLTYELSDNELRDYFDRGLEPFDLNEILEPGEKVDITIGTLYPRPTNCGVLPNMLFSQENRSLYNACADLVNEDISTDSPFTLGLKIDFCLRDPNGSCMIIPCGQISYP